MRRFLRVVLACALALPALVVPSPALAKSGTLEQLWQIEGMYVGDVGATAKTVVVNDVSLGLAKGEWAGAVRYEDVLGIEDGNGVISQVCSMTLDLTGSTSGGGTAVTGRFSGVAELDVRAAGTLSDAASPRQIKLPRGEHTVYDVSGFWAGDVSGDAVSGELLFQSARQRGSDNRFPKDATWFNRFAPDSTVAAGLGDPQRFAISAQGVAPVPPGTEPAQPTTNSPTGDHPVAQTSVVDYIVRGIKGVPIETPVPVTGEQAAAARALIAAAPTGAFAVPPDARAIDLDVSGAFLDAKNRAAGLLDENRAPIGAWADDARGACEAIYAAVPSAGDAGASGSNRGAGLAEQLDALLAKPGLEPLPGAPALREDAQLALTRPVDASAVVRLRAYLSAVQAIAVPPEAGAGLNAAVIAAAAAAADSPIPRTGALAGAALAAADNYSAPAESLAVTAFTRDRSLDSTRGSAVSVLPVRVLTALRAKDASAPLVTWDGEQTVDPVAWPAYRRGDGAVFWLAGRDGPVALTDSTLTGFAWRLPRTSLVRAARVGRVLVVYPL